MKQENINKFVEEIWDNIFWEDMEIAFYKDGDNWIRQQGSKGADEDEIIYTLPLSFSYWGDSYFITTDEDDEPIKDENMKGDFMEDMTSQIKRDLDL
ncbi:MAG: hypothetical protein L0J18_12960 [Tetragenococcus koreensis]|nr:hypothetical protein [Tetragenococcus koreensis]